MNYTNENFLDMLDDWILQGDTIRTCARVLLQQQPMQRQSGCIITPLYPGGSRSFARVRCKNENESDQDKIIIKEDDALLLNKFGQGAIRKKARPNKNGTEYVYWKYRYYSNYARKTLTAKTRGELVGKIKALQGENKPVKAVKEKLTLAGWIDTYQKTYYINLSKKTVRNYKVVIAKHISAALMSKELAKITNTDIQQMLNGITSTQQRSTTKIHLMSMLKKAYDDKLIKITPWLTVKVPKPVNKKRNTLSREDEGRLLAELNQRHQDAVVGYLNTGCRLMELVNVVESDIDRVNCKLKIRGTKTRSSNRIIPLLPKAAEVLPLKISASRLQNAVKEASDKLGLGVSVHCFRHTFATRCLENGINIKTIQKWLGHSCYKTTADTYSHIDSSFEDSEIDKFE